MKVALADQMLSQLMMAKCNQIIKLFLEIPMLKIFMTMAVLSKQVKDGEIPEDSLFGADDGKDASLRKSLIQETLKALDDWKSLLEKDHKGKPTFFLMIHRAVFQSDQIVIEEDAKNLPDFFVPTEKDHVIRQFNDLSEKYQNLLSKFSPGQKGITKSILEASIMPVLNFALDVQASLRDIRSRLESPRTLLFIQRGVQQHRFHHQGTQFETQGNKP